jgi:hypothetical protein
MTNGHNAFQGFLFDANPERRGEAEEELFGRALTAQEYRALIGDIDGNAPIHVRFYQAYGQRNDKEYPIRITARKPDEWSSTVRIATGDFNHSEMKVWESRQGASLDILRLIANTAASWAEQLDISFIEGDGIRDENSCGYYVFPRYGYDAAIPECQAARTGDLANVQTMLELMSTQEGRDWWRANGVTVTGMRFSLADGSVSWNRLNAYANEPG